MPGALAIATVVPGTVFPQTLSLAYTESSAFPMFSVSYHDGTIERSLIQDGVNAPRSLRTWTMTKRLTAADLTTLQTFFTATVQSGWLPFYFYSPYDQILGQPVGSNYDPTGVSTQGRATVKFATSAFTYTGLISRANVGELMLMEIA